MAGDRAADDPIAIALRVAGAVEAAGGAYFVGGSLASSLQGEPRATNDIDMVIELPAGRLDRLLAALGADFEVDVDTLLRVSSFGGSCNIFYLPLVTKIDLFAVGREPYDEVEFARRQPVLVRPSAEVLQSAGRELLLSVRPSEIFPGGCGVVAASGAVG